VEAACLTLTRCGLQSARLQPIFKFQEPNQDGASMKNQQPDSSLRSAKELGIALAIFFIFLLIVVFCAAFSQK